MKNAQTFTALLAIIVSFSLSVFGENLEPLTVSPGAMDRVTGVEVRCPTFSWQAVPGAVGYEVVVYELLPEVDLAGWSLDEAVEVLFVELPVGVTGWTPSLESGLARGADHVWFVRGVYAGGGEDATEWSVARFFRVAGTLAQAESGLVNRGRSGDLGTGSGSIGANSRGTETGPGRSAMAERVGETKTKDVSTAMAAIRGEMPDATGETYGVVGTSNSLEGGGLGAVNTTEGPDLVLDGAANGRTDLRLFDWGLDRSSPGVEVFGLTNEGGGSIDLWVQGNVHAGELFGDGAEVTDVDAASLDGMDGSFYLDWSNLTAVPGDIADGDNDTLVALAPFCASWQVPKWDGSQWVCWWDADALAGLACATGEVAKWNGSNWVCEEDAGISYTAGPGVIIEGGRISIDPSAVFTRVSILDDDGRVGVWNSIAIGADGRGLISYYDDDNENLKVAHCADTVCASATTATLDSVGEAGEFTSIAIGADGLGLISYWDRGSTNLKVAHCTDVACSGATTATLDNGVSLGLYTSIAIGADGLGLVSYYDLITSDLKVAHCADVACTSATTSILDSPGAVGSYTSIAIGTDGFGLISYSDNTNGALKVAHCADTACTSATTATLGSTGVFIEGSSITIGADGMGLISYADVTNEDLKVAHCTDVACTGATTTTLESMVSVGGITSITVAADGLGLISYHGISGGTNSALKVAHCADIPCTNATTAVVDSVGGVGMSSIAVGADGLGLTSYYDTTNGALKVVHLGTGVP